jgi:putative ubiquitin-RnfH superfamily antitoxin RatB of RatAB toxin-antitoxin module
MVSEPGGAQITVNVVYSAAPRKVQEVWVHAALGCSVADVLAQAALQMGISAAQLQGLQLGVWGKKVAVNHPLSDADRLELYRPLTVDPKVARRARFARQGAKSAGLFAKRRANSKAGY